MSSIQHGRLYIAFGATCEPLTRQVRDCNLRLDPGQADVLQACADSITRLKIHSILSDGEAHKARQRLMKAIVRATTDNQGSAPIGPGESKEA